MLANPVLRRLIVFVTVALFSGSLLALYFVMREVMDVGGFCAVGGPYQIKTPCPEGTVLPAVLAPPVMAISFIVYIVVARNSAGAILFWAAIFGSLGWNFIEKGLLVPRAAGEGTIWGWMVPGATFWLMAAVPLLFLVPGRINAYRQYRQADREARAQARSRFLWSSVVHLAAIAAGTWGAVKLFF